MPEHNKHLFRKTALDRMSSPEQLDLLIKVVPSQAWLALIAVIGLLAMALTWGWLGSIPTIVKGSCIIMNQSGLASVNSGNAGRITELYVKAGDMVFKDQAIAVIAQAELDQQLEQLKAELRELKEQQSRLAAYSKTSNTLSLQAAKQQRFSLKRELSSALENISLAKSRTATQQELLSKGLVTNQTVILSEQATVQAQLKAESVRSQQKNLSLQTLEKDKQVDDEQNRLGLRVSSAERSIEQLKNKILRNSIVRSSYTGRVVEISTVSGGLVSAGASVVKLEEEDGLSERLEAICYVDTKEAKKAKAGMQARIIPSTVKREESGFMEAQVESVSKHSVSDESMMQRLQNRKLISQFSKSSAPSEIVIRLLRDGDDYQWSSIANGERDISSGTLSETEIIILRQRPLSLVIPTLKKTLGID
jgi:HlyD family secretion protein